MCVGSSLCILCVCVCVCVCMYMGVCVCEYICMRVYMCVFYDTYIKANVQTKICVYINYIKVTYYGAAPRQSSFSYLMNAFLYMLVSLCLFVWCVRRSP